MRIEIAVDELVLEGFDPRDRHRIADALEWELADAIDPGAIRGLATRGGALAEVGPLEVALQQDGRRSTTPGMRRRASVGVARRVSGAIAGALGQAGVTPTPRPTTPGRGR